MTCRECGVEKEERKFRQRNLVCSKCQDDKRRQNIRLLIEEQKQGPCADCGGTFPSIVMDFDHVRGEKKFNISDAPHLGIGDQRLFEEIAKSQLCCSNCHRIRSYKRGQVEKRWEPTERLPVKM